MTHQEIEKRGGNPDVKSEVGQTIRWSENSSRAWKDL